MLTHEEYNKLAQLRNELAHHPNALSRNKVLLYLQLIQKEGPKGQREVQELMRKTGTYSIEGLATKLSSENGDNTQLIEGLIYAGLGILLGWALLEAMRKQ